MDYRYLEGLSLQGFEVRFRLKLGDCYIWVFPIIGDPNLI